ncbi:MAG: flagellar assembly protein FliH [Planctomycetaceae bacterium]|nr:flagellar assembly protein FliH [Planctomycetaceae bacterium]
MAGILKAGQPASAAALGPSSVYQFEDLEDDCRNRARREAERIVADAHAQAAHLRLQAAEEGKQEALAALRERIDQQAQSAIEALGRAASAIEQSREAWQQQWEKHAVTVALAIARRIVRRELAHAPEIAVDLVRQALELASGNQRIVVRMNPADHANLGPQVAKVVEQLRLVGQTQIVADAAIDAGGCKVETDCGTIDAQLAAQLERIAEELA